MAPTTLFDKSFLQSLSVDESVFFDHFFYPIICPLFYVETLADLEKAIRQGRSPEQEVGIVAQKTPEMNGGTSIHHAQLALASLMGNDIPMNGRIVAPAGNPVRAQGRTGMVYEWSPEAEAFSRWQKGEFLQVERQFASVWRAALSSLDLTAAAESMRALGIDSSTCKSLEEAQTIAHVFVTGKSRPYDRMKLACLILGVSPQYSHQIVTRWQICGQPALFDYAPYAAYVISIEIFFQIALGANLIGAERASNRVDIAYMFYLPFCQIFVSSDKLHKRCATLFLRSDQSFVWGEDLKIDLRKLHDRYKLLPESEREKGIMHFARRPPEDQCLISRLWDRHLRPWRGQAENIAVNDPPQDEVLIDSLRKLADAPPLQSSEVDFPPDDADVVVVQHRVHKRKGSWYQLPKDLKVTEDP